MNLLDINTAFEKLKDFDFNSEGTMEESVTRFCVVIDLDLSVSELLSVLPRELPSTKDEFVKLMYLAARAIRD